MTNHSLDRLAPNGEATGRVDAAGRGADQGSPGDYSDRRESPHSRDALGERLRQRALFPAFLHDWQILVWLVFNIWWGAWHV